jgi:leucyl aminopeptidase
MKTTIVAAPPQETVCDALLIGTFESQVMGGTVARLDGLLGGHLSIHVREEEFEGKEGSALAFHTHGKIPAKKLILLGLGPKKGFVVERLRRAAGRMVKLAKAGKARKAAVSLPFEAVEDGAQAVCEGLFLASYDFDGYKSPKDAKKTKKLDETVVLTAPKTPIRQLEASAARAAIMAEAVAHARTLVNTPALDMTPKHLVDEATKVAMASKRVRLKVRGREDLAKMGCGGILAVAQGSQHEPYLLHLTYRPAHKAKARVVLVGKGVTFDSGGLSLKPSESMMDMKIDMAGAAAVISVFKALPLLDLPVEVHGVAGLVENMPSGTAIRPGDIVRTMSGKTIEILNTDAEGRVTLADTLHYGAKLRPDAMIDLATLTGACMVALGQEYAGLMTDDERLARRLAEASEATGEALWRLPLPDDYAEQVKSRHADVKNITGSRYGGAINAGLFLKEFVPEGLPWAHIDMAGPAYNEKDYPDYRAWGASGWGVRLLLEYLRRL